MSVLSINGVNVYFPYEEPYEIQRTYMEKVLLCLEQGKHGVLESPTGTGKTLCLFAPVTAWLRSRKANLWSQVQPVTNNESSLTTGMRETRQRVWYTARTHSQIAQTISEVRRCNIEGLSIRVIGARDQLCIHPNVSQEKDSSIKTVKCKELVKNRSCKYYRELDFGKHGPAIYQPGEVLDIEDLVSKGRGCGICPYHLARTARDSADIVLMPYNYVLERDSRGSDGGAYKGGILIFDEGHNVPNTCEESFEFTLTGAFLALGVNSVKELMENLTKMTETRCSEELDFDLLVANSCKLLEVLISLESQLSEYPISSAQYPLQDLLAILKKAGVTKETSQHTINCIDHLRNYSHELSLSGPMLTTLIVLERVIQTLFGVAVSSFDTETVEKSFKFAVTMDPEGVRSKKLSLYCFNPSIGIKDVLLLGVQSLIFTSGTLSPLRTFIHELGLPNDLITLENRHIVSKCQVPFMIVGTGVNNVRMDASFTNRTNEAYMYSLGMTLTNLISSVPDGVLLLFSSYSVMQSLKEYWEGSCGVWNRLTRLKRVFMEPKGKEDFITRMENYRRAIEAGNGAVLMGVLRGKISEGMDFKDQYCRAVFIVGVPFPPVNDPRVKGKTKYAETLMIYNQTTKRKEPLYPNNIFMTVEAMKATNQAIGRVIRHRHDYGAIILVDHRFSRPGLYFNVSRWLRDDRPSEVNFPVAKKTLREFFKNIREGAAGVPEIVSQRVKASGEPIAQDFKCEVYDHKMRKRNFTSFTYSSVSTPSRNAEEERENLVLDYEIYKNHTMSSINLPVHSSPVKSQSVLEGLESFDAKMNLQPNSPPIDISMTPEGNKGNKSDDSPPSLSKKPRRNNFAPKPEPERENTERRAQLKAELTHYIKKVQNLLPAKEGYSFKENIMRYFNGEISLLDSFTSLKKVLAPLPESDALIIEFRKCVKSGDRGVWEKLSSDQSK